MKENTGKTKYILLGLLAHSPMTGYTIKKAIEYELNHFWQESFGQIYPTLKRLVEDGLAEYTDESSNGRGQKTYMITEAGREELNRWLLMEPEVEKLRYEILLKVSFGEMADPNVILGHLDDFITRNEKHISEMNQYLMMLSQLSKAGSDHTYKELTCLCGKYTYTALRDWALEAKKIITQRKLT